MSCPEDLKNLRNLCNFKGVENFRCDMIAFIDSLIGDGCGLGVPVCLVVADTAEVEVQVPKRARLEVSV